MLSITHEFSWKGLHVYNVNGEIEVLPYRTTELNNTKVISQIKPNEIHKFNAKEIYKGIISTGVYNLIKNSIK